jgi:hypothetical protein
MIADGGDERKDLIAYDMPGACELIGGLLNCLVVDLDLDLPVMQSLLASFL